MEIRIRDTGQVVMESEFRAMFPDTSFPVPLTLDVINAFGGDPIMEGPQAQLTRYQTAYRDGVQEIGGKWFTKYSVADMDDAAKTALDAQQAASMRTERNRRLSDCDWTQIADSTADKQAWATYRQSLRDVPSQDGFPWEINWPIAP
jgi:Phage tail assembly chaperone protein